MDPEDDDIDPMNPVPAFDAEPVEQNLSDAGAEEQEETQEGSAPESKGEVAPEPEAPPAPVIEAKPRKDWKMSRVHELTAEKEALKAKIAAFEARERGDVTEAPPVDISTMVPRDAVTAEAARIVAEQRRVEDANRVFDAGVAAHPDFIEKRDDLVGAMGDRIAQRPDFLEAITSLPNGHDVFYALGSDLDQANEVLSLPTAKMAIALAEMSNQLKAPKTRALSGAPAPIRPVNGSAKGGVDIYDDDISDEEFYAIRERQRKAAWEARN